MTNPIFDEFKRNFPTNQDLVRTASEDIIGEADFSFIKENISGLIKSLHDRVYDLYKVAEKNNWERLVAQNYFSFYSLVALDLGIPL